MAFPLLNNKPHTVSWEEHQKIEAERKKKNGEQAEKVTPAVNRTNLSFEEYKTLRDQQQNRVQSGDYYGVRGTAQSGIDALADYNQRYKRMQQVLSQYSMDYNMRKKLGTSNPVETMAALQGRSMNQLQKDVNAWKQQKLDSLPKYAEDSRGYPKSYIPQKEEPKQRPAGFMDWNFASNLLDPDSKLNAWIARRPQEEQDAWAEMRNNLYQQLEVPEEYNDNILDLLRIKYTGPADPVKDYKGAINDYYVMRDANMYKGNDVRNMSYTQLQQGLADIENKYQEELEKEAEYRNWTEEDKAKNEKNTAEAANRQRLYYELSQRGLPVLQDKGGNNYVPDVSEWGKLDSTEFIRKRPEEYEYDYNTKTEYDRMLYDAINGAGAYDAATEEMTNEEIDALDEKMDKLWERVENGDFTEEAQQGISEYQQGMREGQGVFKTEEYEKEAQRYRDEIANRDEISRLEAGMEGEHLFDKSNIDYNWSFDKTYIDARNIYAMQDVQDRDIGMFGKYIGDHPAQHMTKKQRDVFNGYFENKQYAEAMAYYNGLEHSLRTIMNMHKGAMEEYLYNNGWALPMAGYRILTKPAEGIAGTINTGLAMLGDKKAQDPNSERWDLSRTNANIQNASAERWARQAAEWFGGGDDGFAAQAARLLNGVVFSIADNMTAFAISGGSSVIGGDAAARMAQGMIQLVMSSEATAGEMFKNLENGMDPTRAGILAFGSGIIEAVTEKYSLEQILDPNVRELLGTKGAFMKYLGKSALAEGSEEIASDLLDTGLQYIMYAIDGHEPELLQQYEQLLAEGKTENEATWIVLGDYMKQLGTSGLAGALSGLLMSGSRGIGSRTQYNSANTEIGSTAISHGVKEAVANAEANAGENADEKTIKSEKTKAKITTELQNEMRIITVAQGMKEDTESRKLGDKIYEDFKKGKVNKADYGKLIRSIVQESSTEIGNLAQDMLGDTLKQQLISSGVEKEKAEELSRILVDGIVNNQMTPVMWMAISDDENARRLWNEYTDFLDKTKNIRNMRSSVMELLGDARPGKIANVKENIAQKMAVAKYVTEQDEELKEALAAGEKRTGSALEVVADGKIGNVVGFDIKEVKGEHGKTWIVQAKVQTGDQTISVDIDKVRSTNENGAKMLQLMGEEKGQSIGENIGVALIGMGDKVKDMAGAAADAVSIMWEGYTGQKAEVKTLKAEQAQLIREAAQRDMKAADEAAARNRKELKPGQGVITYKGKTFGTKEFQDEISKLTPAVRNEANFIASMMKSIGMDVEFTYDDSEKGSAEQGLFYGGRDGGGIRINLAGTYTKEGAHRSAVATVDHEATHWLRANNPEAFRQLSRFVLNRLGGKFDLQSELRHIMDNYAYYGEHLTMDKAVEELIAMSSEKVLTNERLVKELKEEDPTLFGKVKHAINRAITMMKRALTGVNTSSSRYAMAMSDSLDELARVWKIALDQAKGVQGAGEGAAAMQSVMDVNQDVVTKGMSDAERFSVLSGTSVAVKNATGMLSEDELKYFGNLKLRTAEDPFAELARRYGLIKDGNKDATILRNKYIKGLEAVFSNNGLQESLHQQKTGFANLAALFPVFGETFENAVPVLIQDDRYELTVKKESGTETYMYLLGAYKYGNSIIPVQFEVKKYSDVSDNKLYVVATIRKDAAMSNAPARANSLEATSSEVSIKQIIKNIKPDQINFLRVLPSQLLSTEQKKGKREGLARQGGNLHEKAVKAGKENTDTVHMTTERIDGIISKYSNKAYIANINPSDFVDLTVTNADRLLNKGRVLVASEMQKEETTPFLKYDQSTGRITGFDGRNRMAALAGAKVKNAAVLMIPSNAGNNFKNETIDTLAVNGKGRTVEVTRMIPVNEENRDNIINEYGNKDKSWFRYSMRMDDLDQQYADAVARGDWRAAEDMLLEKMQQTEGITGYRAPHFYAGEHKDIARLIKSGNQDVINSIVEDMAQHVPENAVLIPMPPHEGKVTDSTDTMILAKALSKATGAQVINALESDYHESRYKAKAAGDRSVNAQTMGFRQIAEIQDGMMPVFIDNMVGGGQTAMAAKNAIGRGITLAYAQSSRAKSQGVKAVSVTYDQDGKLIPLSQRMDPNNKSWKYSMRDDRYMDVVNDGDMETAQWMVDQMAEAVMENSKVRGEDGKLLKMYHGTKAAFNEFKREFIGSTGRFEGSGFNFTPYEGRAKSYGGNVLAGYLDIQNPLSAEKKTISIQKLAQIIREADPTGDNIISDYARETRDYGTEAFIRRESLTAARNIWESSDNDVDIYSYISSADSDAEGLIAKFEELGYDGLIHYDENGKIKTAIAFNSNQFKLADAVTYDENGDVIPLSERFNSEKADIRYSIRESEQVYKSLNISPEIMFTGTMEQIDAAEKAEEERAEEFRKLIDRNEFMALEFVKPDGRREILHASTRPGIRYQLSYIGSDGQATMHQNYGLLDKKAAGDVNVHSMDELYRHFVNANLRSDLKFNVMEDDGQNRGSFSFRDDTDYDVRQWMETVPEWSLGTEAEKKLLGDYKSLRMKAQLDRERMRKIDNEIKKLEQTLGDRSEGTVKAKESMENALESAGIAVRDGHYLQKDGVIVGKIGNDGTILLNKGTPESVYTAMKSAGFTFVNRKGTYSTEPLNAPGRTDGKPTVNLLGESEAKKQLDALRIRKQNLQTVMDQTEEKLNKILGDEGFGRMMYQQQKVLEDFAYNKTQGEVTDAVNRMERAAKEIQARIEENRKATEELEKSGVVGKFRQLLGTTTAEQTAAELKKQFSSTWTAKQIRAYLDPIILKMKSGQDFQQDVETLAGILVGSDSRNRYETLEELRGLTITLGKGAQKELKAQNSSLKEVRARLAGTGITVKFGDRSTLEADIEDLRATYPMIPELGDEKDALGNFLNWIDSMKSASAGMEFYDQRLAEAMAVITGKAAGAAKGIYMPNDPKAQQQVLAMMDFVKGLNAETEQAQKALADVAKQMETMQRAGAEANTKAQVLMRDVNVALDYYNKISRMAVDETKLQKTSAIIEQLKSKQAQEILKNNEEWRALIQRDKDAQKQLEDNRKKARMINTNLKRMWKLLKEPKGLNNIPEHMQGLAREVISRFVNNDMGNGLRFLQATQEELADRRRILDAWDAQDGKFDVAALAAMEETDVRVNAILNDLDAIENGLREINRKIRGKNKLDSLQRRGEILKGIQEAVSEIYSAIKAEQEVQMGDRRVAIEDAAYDVAQGTGGKKYREWTGAVGQKMAMLHKFIVSGNMTPEYFFRTLGNAGLSDLWENYHNAENRNGLELKKAQDALAKIAKDYGYKNWDTKQKIKLQLESGETEITLGQLMSLWATWRRETTLGPAMSEHLTKGGFYAEPDLRDGLLGRQAIEKKAHRVTEADMKAVEGLLTEEQRKFVDAVVGYMSTDMSELGNEASMAAYGIKLYKESYYFPFQMWDGVRTRKSNDAGSAAGSQNQAFHPSFSKSRLHGANNAVMLGDFMTTAADHIAGMINYATMGLANENLNKVLNAKTSTGGEYDTQRNTRAILEEAYGKEALKYLMDLKVQLEGGAVKIDKTFYDKLISLFRKNAVAGSLSVALQQPLSYLRAAMMIDSKYLARALSPDVWKGSYKEMMAHSGVAVIKEMGRFDMNFGSSAREYLMPDGKEGKARQVWDWVTEKATVLPELMDRMTWTRMWSAVKAEQKALHPEMDVKSDQFLDMCGVRFNDIMRRTQVYDSTLVKSANMRNQNPVMKMFTSFMAEPTLTTNVLMDSYRQAVQGEKGGKMAAIKATAIFLLSAVAQAAVKGAMGARRNPDEKKTWGENFWYRFWYNFVGEANPLQLIPGYSDLITVLKGGDIKDDAMGALSKFFTAGDKAMQLIQGKTEDPWRGVEDSAGQIVQLMSGLPLKNIMRDLRATWNWIGRDPYAKREDSEAVLKYQAIDTLMNSDTLLGAINKKLGEAGWETSNSAYYKRIYDAKKQGREQDAADMIDYLLYGKGVKEEKTITSQVNSLAKKDRTQTPEERLEFLQENGAGQLGAYVAEMYENGEIDREQAEKMYREANPKADSKKVLEALDKVDYKLAGGQDESFSNYTRLEEAMDADDAAQVKKEKEYLVSNGYEEKDVTDKMKGIITDKYKKGEIDKTKAEAQLKKYRPDLSADDIFWTLDLIDYKNETGNTDASGKCYRLWDAMDKNKAEEIRSAVKLITKHGMEPKNIKTQITNKYKNAYLEADSKGKVKIKDAIEKAYRELGYSKDDADKVINGWKKDK